MSKTILITGASTGMGRAIAEYFAEKGWNVAATMRRPDDHRADLETSNLACMALDVTRPDSVNEAIGSTLSRFGGLDVVVNNAGYGIVGPMEGASEAQIDRQIATNLRGPITVMRAALPHFRARKSGTFINVTSVGGRVTMPMNSLYHATKWGLEGLTEGLSYELAPLGIKVKLIEPGGTKTDFTTRSLTTTDASIDPAYMGTMEAIMTAFRTRVENWSSVDGVVEAVWQAATDGTDRLRYPVGEDAKAFLAARESMSDEDFMAMVTKSFGLK